MWFLDESTNKEVIVCSCFVSCDFTPRYLLFPQMFVALIFWYQFYCGFSGSAMIDQWYLIFFNLMFSAFPQLITGTLDKDVSAETLQQLPQLYVNGQNSEVRSTFVFLFVRLSVKGSVFSSTDGARLVSLLHRNWILASNLYTDWLGIDFMSINSWQCFIFKILRRCFVAFICR